MLRPGNFRRKMIIKSGTPYGFGTHKWRGVTHLSKEAKEAIDAGGLVICDRPFPGEPYYIVCRKGNRYDHRLPTATEAEQIKAAGF